MKKYILFFISIGLLLGVVLVWNTVNIEKGKSKTFSESGYILDSDTERYYFYEDEIYKSTYNNKIVFNDTEGVKVSLDNDSFIHYSSGNIVGLQDGVLLDLSIIDNNPIIYYNVVASKEIKKISNRYMVKNLNNDLQFEQAIWKISPNKYIVLGNDINITLENGAKKQAKGYIEIEYSDNEVVSIYNQEMSFKTISSNSYIELSDNIKINLGNKIVRKKDENKLSLEDMVINSNDNVTLVDLNAEDESSENENADNETTQTPSNDGGITNSNSSTSNTQSQTIINQGSTANNSQTNIDENEIEIKPSSIKYDNLDENETQIDNSKIFSEPKFKLDDIEITAVSFKGNVKITDDHELLSKEDKIKIKIINNKTGKTVSDLTYDSGKLDIPLEYDGILSPDTQYSLIVSATYVVNGIPYTKNFLYKTFITDDIKLNVQENGFTDTSLNFILSVSDEDITKATILLLDLEGNIVKEEKDKELNNKTYNTYDIRFTGLKSDTQYKLKISNITYQGIERQSSSWVLDFENYKTLKSKASIDSLNYSIDKKNNTFKLYIDGVTDKDTSIQKYTYIVYEYKKITQNGQETLKIDTDEIKYQRETASKEIVINVGEDETKDSIVKGKYYGFKVIANIYDNEKYVDIESEMCGTFIISTKTFPTIRFEKQNITPTSIDGTLYITDIDFSIVVDPQNPLRIECNNSFEKVFEYKKYSDKTLFEQERENGEGVIQVPVHLDGLKANESYTISTYGTIDLDKNGEGNIEPDKNVRIGSAIVTTSEYNNILGTFANNQNKEANAAFSINFHLYAEDLEKDRLDSITFILKEGSDLSVNSKERFLVYKNGEGGTNLKNLMFDNTLTINPTMFGGKDADYNETNYILLATATVDSTDYLNKIPITINGDNSTGNITYTDVNGEEYSAIYMKVDGKERVASWPNNGGDNITISAISNKDASSNGIQYNSKLQSQTVVGYKVHANKFPNDGNLKILSVKYFLWDKDMENEIRDADGNQCYEIEWNGEGTIPSAIFKVKDTEQEIENGKMYRGNKYNFSYDVIFIDKNGNQIIWSENSGHTNKELHKEVYLDKEAPTFIMYPTRSDNNSITYTYNCKDHDRALNYINGAAKIEVYAGLDHQVDLDQNIDTNTNSNKEVTINCQSEKKYTLKYSQKLNQDYNNVYESIDLVTQKFQGIIDEERIKEIEYEVSYDNDKAPNKLIINFLNNINNIYFDYVAGAAVKFDVGNQETIVTELLDLKIKNNNYYIEADISKLNNKNSIIGKEIPISVDLYYDTNEIGFRTTAENEYAAFVKNTDDNNNIYMGMSSLGVFTEKDTVIGNIFKSTFIPSNSNALITLNNSNQIQLSYSPNGLKYDDDVIVQKIVKSATLNQSENVTIESIIAGIKVNSINTTLTTANISAEIINNTGDDIENIIIEICKLDGENAKANWGTGEIADKEVSIGENGNCNFIIDELETSTYYKIRFKYMINGNTYYMYDIDDKITKKEYEFNTVATIGINNVEVKYNAEKYNEKHLDIHYYINEAVTCMYNKTKYEFYDGDTRIELTVDNKTINPNYSIVGGALIVQNEKFETDDLRGEITETININPNCNIFDFGKPYTINIIPIIESDEEIETISEQFTLPELKEPLIGIKMIRQEENNGNESIKLNINITDNNHVIVDDKYTLEVSKFKIDASNQRSEETLTTIYDGTSNQPISDYINISTTNFFAYIKDNIDFSYNYELKLIYQTNMTNKNENDSIEVKEEIRTLKAISNNHGIEIGSMNAIINDKSQNRIDLRFYNSYKISKINKIKYTIYNNDNLLQVSDEFEPEWAAVGNNDEIEYYKTTLPSEIVESGTYIITLNFYKDNTLINAKEVNYSYSSNG